MQRLKAIFNRLLPRASFARNVGVLAGGTALAQAIGVLALPLITRLYTPEDFSLLAIFSSIVAIVSVAACLRLEIAIPLPESDEEAAHLLVLALGFCALVSGLLGVAVWLYSIEMVALLRAPGLLPYMWMLPLAIWLTGTYSAVQFWATRQKRFMAISKTRLMQTLSSAAAQVGMGLTSAFGALGLFLGLLLSSGAGLLGLGRSAWRRDPALRSRITRQELKRIFKAYDRFPKYSTFESFANIAAIQVPIIIIGAFAIGPEAGYLLLAMKAAAIPLGLIGGAVSQVYLSKAAEEYRQQRLPEFTLKIIDGLLKTGVGPLICIGVVAPSVFPIVFGENWVRSGEMIALMMPWFIVQFLTSPISMSMHVTGNQIMAMNNQAIGLILRVGSVALAGWFFPNFLFESYVITGIAFYLMYFHLIMHVSKMKYFSVLQIFCKRMYLLLGWMSMGFVINSLVKLIVLHEWRINF